MSAKLLKSNSTCTARDNSRGNGDSKAQELIVDRLATLCSELGRYEFHLSIAPLVVEGGTGSPVNPIATL